MAELGVFKRNDAIYVNPNTQNGKHVDIAITVRGSDFYFAWCAVMGAVALGIIISSFMKPRTDRIFFYLTAGVNMTACIAYFALGSNLGWTPIDVEWTRGQADVRGINREIFYVRYIDWFITTPLLLLDILLTAGLPWPTIIWTVFLDWIMIVTGLVGALVKSRYKWGFFSFGCAAMFYIFYNVAWEGRIHAKRLGNDVYRVYLICGVWTLFLWLCYPIAWGVCEGGNVIAPDSEAVFYGVLDFCAKPVFSIMLIVGHWNISPARLGLRIRDVDEDPVLYEKKDRDAPPETADPDAVHNGHTNGSATTTGAQTA
ncbi:family A G protein-coupled receptor-like protein, partial [Aureobasidium melanogenum]